MDDLEEKLNSVLSNPEMMQKIMSMAQAFQSPTEQKTAKEVPKDSPFPDLDLGALQKLSSLAKQGNIDKEQQTLLRALNPYLSRERIRKLENAMRAARMARFAAAALGQQGLKSPFSR